MHFIPRNLSSKVKQQLQHNPVVALLGPRQCGKSTLAKTLLSEFSHSIYLDLEKTSDLAKLNDIWAFFKANASKLICLDEVQMKPDIFSQIRSFVDEEQINGKFLLLGSASKDLLQQSSESLAGRISYLEMRPFQFSEVLDTNFSDYWLKGAFPKSLLQSDLETEL